MEQFTPNNTITSHLPRTLGTSLVLLLTATAMAAPVVDGRFDPDEGYTLGRSVEFDVERSSLRATGGELWTHQGAGGDVFVSFTQPVMLVDNSYGANSIGWGSDAPSGKRHNFSDLLGSDKAQFVFTDAAGNTVLDVTVDYLSGVGGGYRSLGVTGGDGEVSTGSASDVLAWGTSLDYNFNTLGYVLTGDSPATDEDYTENADYPGWLFEVGYELWVDGQLFAANGFGDVAIPLAHDSPNKLGKNKVYPFIEDPLLDPSDAGLEGQTPEPATMLLVLGGGMVLLRRPRR